jgi:hypothetical protein
MDNGKWLHNGGNKQVGDFAEQTDHALIDNLLLKGEEK